MMIEKEHTNDKKPNQRSHSEIIELHHGRTTEEQRKKNKGRGINLESFIDMVGSKKKSTNKRSRSSFEPKMDPKGRFCKLGPIKAKKQEAHFMNSRISDLITADQCKKVPTKQLQAEHGDKIEQPKPAIPASEQIQPSWVAKSSTEMREEIIKCAETLQTQWEELIQTANSVEWLLQECSTMMTEMNEQTERIKPKSKEEISIEKKYEFWLTKLPNDSPPLHHHRYSSLNHSPRSLL